MGVRMLTTVDQVKAAEGLARDFQSKAKSGAVSEADAKAQAAAAIGKIRYAGSEYVWINDMHPTMVMHPIKPDLNGKDLTSNKDPNGKQLFVEMVQALQNTEEFRAAGIGPVSRQRIIMLLGGLRELTATTVEEGGRMSDITDEAVAASIALLHPRSADD